MTVAQNEVIQYDPIIQKINCDLFSQRGIEVSVLRLDLIHPQISGNKWFKLKYNLEEAKKQGCDTILTFGGAFSNHVHATAAACRMFGFKSIGVIAGEPDYAENPTLSEAASMGMSFHFVTRNDYRRKTDQDFLDELKEKFGSVYVVPEGGNNYLGSLGSMEILHGAGNFDYVFCSCGTGATFSGLAGFIKEGQHLIGISALKGEGNLVSETQDRVNLIRKKNDLKIHGNAELLNAEFLSNSGIINQYHFGGFARHTQELLDFKMNFEALHNIPLDYVYESKLFYAVNDLIANQKIPLNSKIIVVHSGGIQGNKGYENRYALNPKRNVKDAQG